MPKRAVETEARRRSLNMKTTEALRTKLERAAALSGRVLSHEVEARLEKSLDQDEVNGGEHITALLDYIGSCIRILEASKGGLQWNHSDETTAECRLTLDKALDAVIPGDVRDLIWFSPAAHLLLTQYLGVNTLKMSGLRAIDKALMEHHAAPSRIDDQRETMLKAGEKAKAVIDRMVESLSKRLDAEATGEDDRMTYARWMEFTA